MLYVPDQPVVLIGETTPEQWRKWFAFWNLPLDEKANIVDEYPELIIEKVPSPMAQSFGVKTQIFINPEEFEKIPVERINYHWGEVVSLGSPLPRQKLTVQAHEHYLTLDDEARKGLLLISLVPIAFAILAYKYRYIVRADTYYIGMDYEQDLLNVVILEELLTFYDLTRQD